MPDYSPFYRARGLVEQTPGGSQMYQNVLRQLNRQFGLQQRRETMRGEQLNLPAHLRFAMSQQRQPELYGQYAGGLSRTAAQAPGVDIQKAQALAGIQGQVEQLKLTREQFEEQKRVQRESEKTNWLDVLGTVGGLGLGVAGLMFPPALPFTMAAGAGLSAATRTGGAGQSLGIQQGNVMNWMNPMGGGMGGGMGAPGMGIPMGQAMNWMYPPAYQPAGY